MASFITTNETVDRNRVGALAETPAQIDSYVAEADTLEGVFVVPGSNERGAIVPASAAAVLLALGATLYQEMHQPGGAAGEHYGDNELMSVCRKGVVYVRAEGAPTIGADVYVRHASGGGGAVLGAVRVDDDTSSAAKLPGAMFVSAAAGGMAKVEMNLPQK